MLFKDEVTVNSDLKEPGSPSWSQWKVSSLVSSLRTSLLRPPDGICSLIRTCDELVGLVDATSGRLLPR